MTPALEAEASGAGHDAQWMSCVRIPGHTAGVTVAFGVASRYNTG
ncbi:MAG: hypothetical protein ACLFWB_14000 [Armatimonadota bacterium]